MKTIDYENYKKNYVAAWPRGLKRHFNGDRVITIAWSRLNSHLRRVVAALDKAL